MMVVTYPKRINVMEYIDNHPNVTKQDVVDHFKGEMARVPVFKTIDRLVRYGIIDDNLDPKNRQVHRFELTKTVYSLLSPAGVVSFS